jgi:predicted metal-dependent hydrolase
MKNQDGDERIVELLNGKCLTVGKIRAFTDEEADEAIRSILKEKAKGLSVRKAIFSVSGGDDKLTLRLQNKYRNTLKKQPQKLMELAKELGLDEEFIPTERHARCEKMPRLPEQDFLRRRLENEINALYDRLAQALKVENERLRLENASLKEEIKNGKNA